jgi:hypothetical protein
MACCMYRWTKWKTLCKESVSSRTSNSKENIGKAIIVENTNSINYCRMKRTLENPRSCCRYVSPPAETEVSNLNHVSNHLCTNFLMIKQTLCFSFLCIWSMDLTYTQDSIVKIMWILGLSSFLVYIPHYCVRF